MFGGISKSNDSQKWGVYRMPRELLSSVLRHWRCRGFGFVGTSEI